MKSVNLFKFKLERESYLTSVRVSTMSIRKIRLTVRWHSQPEVGIGAINFKWCTFNCKYVSLNNGIILLYFVLVYTGCVASIYFTMVVNLLKQIAILVLVFFVFIYFITFLQSYYSLCKYILHIPIAVHNTMLKSELMANIAQCPLDIKM